MDKPSPVDDSVFMCILFMFMEPSDKINGIAVCSLGSRGKKNMLRWTKPQNFSRGVIWDLEHAILFGVLISQIQKNSVYMNCTTDIILR